MENAFTIGEKLKQESQEARELNRLDANWQTLRSEIYNRDNGMCWICNKFVELQDYDLGHLVDRCNGGQDTYENLVVMHKACNISKPKHNTLEEVIVWKLRTRYLTTERPSTLFGSTPPRRYYPKLKVQPKAVQPKTIPPDIVQPKPVLPKTVAPKTIPQVIAGDNDLKMEALRLLSQILGSPPQHNVAKQLRPNTRAISYSTYINNEQTYPTLPMARPKRTPSVKTLEEQQTLLDEQIAKIKPQTLVWIQGRPLGKGGQRGVPLWKVLPPPYKQDDLFTMRQTPPGAVDNGQGSIYDTLQVIGGQLSQIVDVTVGHIAIKVSPDGDKLSISIRHTASSNTGHRSQTIGMGRGQIPLTEWYQAKAQGISLLDFKAAYSNQPHASQTQPCLTQKELTTT